MTLASYSIDESPSPGSMTVDQLDKFLFEIRLQPGWRREADTDADYYDGNQLTQSELDDMERLGMAPLIRNLIRPTIDVCLGMEAKTRTDWKVQAEKEEHQEIAEALSMRLKEAEREARADRACSDAYAQQLKTGLGWVEVSRELDPFKYPYRTSCISRREIFWDWRAKEPDLSDARYLVRKRWQDVDILKLMFPDEGELFDFMGFSRANWDTAMTENPSVLGRSWVSERDVTLPESDWRDSTRKRLCLYEVWYRVWSRGFVVRTPDGRTVEVDLENPKHSQAIGMGMIEPIPAIFPKTRLSWWVGPHRIADMPSPYKNGNFPYIPFWGYREDLTGIPYGLIRSMRSPQDEINARLSKMMWLLSAKRVTMTPTAVDDVDEIRREVARPDAMIVLSRTFNQTRDIFKVESDFQLTQQQFEVLKNATEAIQKAGGVYQTMLGDKEKGVTSGVAMNSLVEQGSTTLAEINDNYRFGRRGVGQSLTELIVEDMGQEPQVVNVDKTFGIEKKKVMLNVPSMEKGIPTLTNDVQRAMVKVALEDVPSTPVYRAQQLLMLTEMTKSLPPQIQAFVVPFILESSEMPHRREVADQVRKALGMDSNQGQTYTKEQVDQLIQKAVEEFAKQSEIGIKMKDSDTKQLKAKADVGIALKELELKTKDSETKRLIADATVKKDVLDTQLTVLDTLLAHDEALDQNRGAQIVKELAA